MDYSGRTKRILGTAKVGDIIEVSRGKEKYNGRLMPKSSGSPDTAVLKLASGYNIGIIPSKVDVIKKGTTEKKKEHQRESAAKMPFISIIYTGGTIASKIDYETGGVHPLISSEELINAVPELKTVSNVRVVPKMQIWTEDIEPEHWKEISRSVLAEAKNGCEGIIITQGTDFMHYSAAALSFMLKGIGMPVIFVGSQRSSDRGSSDAAMNLICAARFIKNTDFAGVGICMHGTMNDDYCLIHRGTRVRKMHTSRRDAFRTIDAMPIAKITYKGEVTMLSENYPRRTAKAESIMPVFESRIALVKMRPGFSYKEMEFYEKSGYKGIIIEGSALGHMPINDFDMHTKEHPKLLAVLERMIKKGMIVLMASQCAYGKVNMNVYSTGRKLLDAGVLPVAMMPETAYVKLGWALGMKKKRDETVRIINTDVAGELLGRSDHRTFLS